MIFQAWRRDNPFLIIMAKDFNELERQNIKLEKENDSLKN